MRSRFTFITLLAALIMAALGGSSSAVHAATAANRLALAGSLDGLGHDGTHGSLRTIDPYATKALLQRAPAHTLAGAMHLTPAPARFAYRVESTTARSAIVTLRWTYSYVKTIVDRTVWIRTAAGWRISKVTVLPPPTLSLHCDLPSGGLVSCLLSGQGFDSNERLAINYHLTYLALPRINGSYQEKVWSRFASSDNTGRFIRPPLTFAVVKYHESYRLTAVVSGERIDAATTTVEAIAQ